MAIEAFLYHFHGLDSIDFSALKPDELPHLQKLAADRNLEILPTVYLRREALPRFAETVREYHRLAADDLLPNIAGFAVEGPLLGPQGGIPRSGRWRPDSAEWRSLAELGPLGLKYVVLAPDALALDEEIGTGFTFANLLTEFYDRGLRVALGHFHRDDPQQSARRLNEVLEFLHPRYGLSPNLILTDHLYNDMPRSFTHAWRTPEERTRRDKELTAFLQYDWETADLTELLGPVPAAMLAAARTGLLQPCLNFDGHHVDLEICRKTFAYLGADRLIALTDHTEVPILADEDLVRDGLSELWLRDDGAVAAGGSSYRSQRRNMLSVGLSEEDVNKLFLTNPKTAVTYAVTSR